MALGIAVGLVIVDEAAREALSAGNGEISIERHFDAATIGVNGPPREIQERRRSSKTPSRPAATSAKERTKKSRKQSKDRARRISMASSRR